jgi:prevent-host-death family protein
MEEVAVSLSKSATGEQSITMMRTELVTTLKRRATDVIERLAEDREPILITQHGSPAACLVDVDTFAAMRKKLELLEGIARGEKAFQESRIVTHSDARKRLSRWLD